MINILHLYSHDSYLWSMGSWAIANAACYPTPKKSILRLGGVYLAMNEMMLHHSVEAVQFWGLFALINLVIPGECLCTSLSWELDSMPIIILHVFSDCHTTLYRYADTTSIHCHIYQIACFPIIAMKNFHPNKSIL